MDTDEGDLARLANGRILLVLRPDGGVLASDDDGRSWSPLSTIGPDRFFAPHLTVLTDDTVVCTAGGSGGQSVFLSRDGGQTWSAPFRLDPTVYGYGKLHRLADDTILIAYIMDGKTPTRCYLMRFAVNPARTGIERLPLGAVNTGTPPQPDRE